MKCLSRRTALRSAAWVSALASGSGLRAAVALAAKPVINDPVIDIVASICNQGSGTLQSVWLALVQDYVDRHWVPAHPGVRVTMIPGTSSDGAALSNDAVVASSLAGQAPVTVTGCCTTFPTYLAADLLLPLDSYIKQDNLNLAEFTPAQLATFQRGGQQFALPQFAAPRILVYSQQLLDDLGLAYPEPDWTYDQAEALWRSCARSVRGQWMPGCGLDLEGDGADNWVTHAWGATEADPNGNVCLMNSSESVAAWTWWAQLSNGRVAENQGFFDQFSQGLVAFNDVGGWDVQSCAMSLGSIKWDFFPMPVFPAGKPSTYLNNDLNGINAYSKVPRELSWDMLKLITVDPNFQRLLFRTTLQTPNLMSQWSEWAEIVATVAPPLRGKHLLYFRDAVDYGWTPYYFRYNAVAVANLTVSWLDKILAGQVSATAGLDQLTRQINAMEVAGAATTATQDRQLTEFTHALHAAEATSAVIAVTPPPTAGVGTAAAPASRLVTVRATTGGTTYAITGNGASGVNGSTDNAVFAASSFALSKGTFTCRLVSVVPEQGPALQSGAKIGLMARDSLASEAAAVGIEFCLNRGVHSHTRATDAGSFNDNHAGAAPGLLSQSAVQAASAPTAGVNALLRPIWLRLVADAAQWTPYTSLDGVTWSAAQGPFGPLAVDFLGCWVGLYASSHTTNGRLTAIFDHVSGFRPTSFVQLGSP